MELSAEMFEKELQAAIKAYEHYVVCIDKVPEDCEESLKSLLQKAIKAYINRAPGLRHGIALDKYVTVILSQTDDELPICGIYFNLHSPYKKKTSNSKLK